MDLIRTAIASFSRIVRGAADRMNRLSTDHEEGIRERFESAAVRSGEFRMIRFTRDSNGDYVNDRLQAAWKGYLEDELFMERIW